MVSNVDPSEQMVSPEEKILIFEGPEWPNERRKIFFYKFRVARSFLKVC